MKPTSLQLLLTRTPQCQSRRHPGGWSALSTRYWYIAYKRQCLSTTYAKHFLHLLAEINTGSCHCFTSPVRPTYTTVSYFHEYKNPLHCLKFSGKYLHRTSHLSDGELCVCVWEKERTTSSHIQVNMVLCINTKIQALSGFCLPNNSSFQYIQPTSWNHFTFSAVCFLWSSTRMFCFSALLVTQTPYKLSLILWNPPPPNLSQLLIKKHN